MRLSEVLFKLPHLHERIERGRAELAAAEAALEEALADLPAEQAIPLRLALLYHVLPPEPEPAAQAVTLVTVEAAPIAEPAAPAAVIPSDLPPELQAPWEEPGEAEQPAAPEAVASNYPEISDSSEDGLGQVDQPPGVAAEPVQAAAPEILAEAAPADQPTEPAPEPVEAPAVAEPAAESAGEGWVSCKAYADLCGVSEPVIYNAITKGVIHGPAVQLGPPKRVRPDLADQQILQRIEPSMLRANVAKRVERSTVIEALPPEQQTLTAHEAARILRNKGYQVLECGEDAYQVDRVATTRARLIQRATEIRDRDERLTRSRRSAA